MWYKQDDINGEYRASCDHSSHSRNAWKRMLKMLNKHLPEKEVKRTRHFPDLINSFLIRKKALVDFLQSLNPFFGKLK